MDWFEEFMKNKLFLSFICIIICIILIKIVDIIFKKIENKKGKNISLTFLNAIIKALIVINAIFKIASYSSFLKSLSTTILMSSSLLVVIIGFIFQEGLTNIVHGVIITIWKPFEIGDRIQVNIDNDVISGYVKSINLRHTIITNVLDNADFIIANSQLDKANIKNLSNQENYHKYPINLNITYEDASNKDTLELAKQIFIDTIKENPLTIVKDDIFVKVDLAESSVVLTSFITTKSVEENIIACSEIKEKILEKYAKNNISFAFPHIEVSGIY